MFLIVWKKWDLERPNDSELRPRKWEHQPLWERDTVDPENPYIRGTWGSSACQLGIPSKDVSLDFGFPRSRPWGENLNASYFREGVKKTPIDEWKREPGQEQPPERECYQTCYHCGHLDLSHIGEFWETMGSMCLIGTPPKRQVSVYLFTCQGGIRWGLPPEAIDFLTFQDYHLGSQEHTSRQRNAVLVSWKISWGRWSGAHGDRVKAPAASTMLAFLAIGIWPCSLDVTPI